MLPVLFLPMCHVVCVWVVPLCNTEVSYWCLSTEGHARTACQTLLSSCVSQHLVLFLGISCLKTTCSWLRAELTASHSLALLLGYRMLKHPFSSWYRCQYGLLLLVCPPLQLFWTYIQAMLTNLESLSLERIHSMLKMFVMTGPVVTEIDIQELQGFLQKKVRDQQLIYSGGVYRLPKNCN